jgi:uncharacterized protein YgbK (DUF1537 family)
MHLPTLLREQSRQPVELIGLEDVRAGAAHLAERLDGARHSSRLLVADALTDDDLRTLLEAAALALPLALLCGSAGLIGALAHTLPGSKPSDPAIDMPGSVLLVVGSGSAMARRQIEYLREHHPVTAIEIKPEDKEQNPQVDTSSAQDILLYLPEPAAGAELDGSAARACAECLAASALPLIDRLRPALLVLAGGDTAYHVLSRLNVRRLEVQRELLPGMPLARGGGADGREHRVLLKAGNHGDEATLATLLHIVGNTE